MIIMVRADDRLIHGMVAVSWTSHLQPLTVSAPKLNIVYEDENILLVDKKPGVAVHPHDGAEYGRTLIDHIQAYLYAKREWRPREENSFTPALCNRIDRKIGRAHV